MRSPKIFGRRQEIEGSWYKARRDFSSPDFLGRLSGVYWLY